MAIAPGTRLGPYEIVGTLGAGGMGEVYRARDTQLDRDVAIKILPALFASDPDRLMRFEREAKTLASLNHRHIAHIYGIEQADGARALVMELVEGEDLAARIGRGALPLDEALPIARQIAEALEAAHDAGIVHHDLKPANIRIRPDGTVKVLDFGLAKALDPGGAMAPAAAASSLTITSPAAMTATGVILGTAAYMAPEQARGRAVDKRADIWASGCVLFEMLSGRPPFAGDTITDVLGAIVRIEPEWTRLRADLPPAVRRVLQRCLEKDSRQRTRDIGDVRLDLAAALEEDPGPAAPAPWRPPSPAGAAVALLALAGGAGLGLWLSPAESGHAGWMAARIGGPEIAYLPSVSPDGRMLAFNALVDGQTQVGIVNPDRDDWSLLTRDRARGPVGLVAWSTDGSRIYFDRYQSSGGSVWSVSPLGGDPRLVLENATAPQPLPDGSLLLLRLDAEGRHQLHRHWPDQGRSEPLPIEVYNVFVAAVRAFPDGREAVVFGRRTDERAARWRLLVVDLTSGEARPLATWLEAAEEDDRIVPLGISADGQSVLTTRANDDSASLLAIPRHGGAPRALFTTTRSITGIAEDRLGRVYIDQVDRAFEHLRVTPRDGAVERLAMLPPGGVFASALPMAGGRFLYATRVGDRYRLLAGRPGEQRTLFSDILEDARGPLSR